MNKKTIIIQLSLRTALVWTSCGNKDAKKQGAAQAQAERICPVALVSHRMRLLQVQSAIQQQSNR
jgi:hypothetical protein